MADANTPDWAASATALDDDLLTTPPTDTHLPDLYVGLKIDLLAPGDGVVTDRHHASADRYEADDPMNQIEGQISPFTLSGWLRHGCEVVCQQAGATVCHPGESTGDFRRDDVYQRDLEDGYHEKGACTDDHENTHDEGCLVYDLFGGFGAQPGKLLRRPVSFSPIRRHVDVTDGEAEAHYRKVSSQVRSRNDTDAGTTLRHTQRDVLGNVEGTWKCTLREPKPGFIGLLLAAVAFLDAHSDDYAFQIGGARNFGAGIADAWVINPLYTEAEIRRIFNRTQAATATMDEKDDRWADEYRETFLAAFHRRLQARVSDATRPILAGTPGGDAA